MYDVPISWPALIQVPHGKAVWELKWILVPCHKNRGRAHGRAPWQTRAHVPQSNCVGKLWAQIPNSVETSHVVKGAFYPGIDATGSVLYIKVGLKPGMKWGERYCVSCYLVSVMCCAVSTLSCVAFYCPVCSVCLFVCLSVCLFVLVLFYFLLFSFVFVTPTGGTEWKEAELAGSIRECGKSFWHTHLIRHREVLHIGFSFWLGPCMGIRLCAVAKFRQMCLWMQHMLWTAFQETCVSVEHCGSSFDDQEAATSKSEQCQDFGLCSFGGDGCTHHSPNTMPKQEQLTHSPGQLSTFVCPARSEAVRRWDIICDMIWYDMIWYDIKRYDMIWYVFIFICIHSLKQALVYYFVLQFVLAQCLSCFFHPVFCPPVAWSLLCA